MKDSIIFIPKGTTITDLFEKLDVIGAVERRLEIGRNGWKEIK